MAKNKKNKHKSLKRQIFNQFIHNKSAVLGLITLSILLILGLISIFATETDIGAKIFEGTVFDYDSVIQQDLTNQFAKPSAEHWLGLDDYGRDILARLLYAIRISVSIGVLATALAVIIGVFFGALAGYYGGIVDQVIMRFMDIWLAIPAILLAIVIVSSFGNSLFNLLVAIAVSSVPGYARILRSSILSVKDNEYVEAAHCIGANDFYIIMRHILPNCLSPLIVQSTLGVAGGILAISSLSFLGIGIQPPDSEWGNMLAAGRDYMVQGSHLVIFPGIMIIITILSLNLLGDGLRDALDPKLKK